MDPLGIAGAWTIGDRRGREPGQHLGHRLWTVTGQVRHLEKTNLSGYVDIHARRKKKKGMDHAQEFAAGCYVLQQAFGTLLSSWKPSLQ